MLTEAWYTWHVLRSELEDTGSLTILYHFCICLSCINGQLFTDVPYLVPEVSPDPSGPSPIRRSKFRSSDLQW